MNRAEGMADSVTQEQLSCPGDSYQSSVGDRAELKGKAAFASLHFPLIFLHESAFFLWDAVIKNPSGLRLSRRGLRPKMGRS